MSVNDPHIFFIIISYSFNVVTENRKIGEVFLKRMWYKYIRRHINDSARVHAARAKKKRFSMKRRRICTAVIIVCAAAAGILAWCLTHNGIRKQIGTSEYCFYKYGIIDRKKNGLLYDRGAWWYVNNGRVDTEYTGLTEYRSELWRIRNGTIDFSYTGFDRNETGWWYVEGGKVRTDVTGLRYGVVRTDLTGGFYGRNLPGIPALFDIDTEGTAGWWYVKDGKVMLCDTIIKENSRWWCIRSGRVWFSWRGIAENENGRFYVSNGRVRFGRNGVYRENGGTYLLESGKVTGEIHRDSTRFIAHRGLRSEAPENTIKAFELAGEAGFWGCETDVRLTADGRYVLLHDESFLRMCGVDAAPGDLTEEEIRQLVLINGSCLEDYGGDVSAVSAAFLEDYLDICLKYNMVPVMDIKFDAGSGQEGYDQMQRLYRTAKAVLGAHEAVFLASDFSALCQMRQVLEDAGDTEITLQLLLRDTDTVTSEELLRWGMNPDIKYAGLQEDTISRFQEMGLAVNVWTVDDPYKIDFLLSQGADYITTNKRFW